MLQFLLLALTITFTEGVWVKEMDNPGLYQGDMVLSPDQLNQVKKGTFGFGSISDRSKLWINGNGEAIVPYQIESSLRYERKAIAEIDASINEYHKYTCIRFVKMTGSQSNYNNYISFYKGGGCSSPVGKRQYRGGNRISLADGCWWRATIIHEIGHSLGLHHEQSRPDRDQYVEVLKYNIHSGTEFNFDKERDADVNSLGTPYDYLSVMHYNWNAFGKDQKMTIRTKDPKYQYFIGQDEGFSRIDVKQLNLMYKCTGSYPQPPEFVFPPPGCYDTGGACGKSRHAGDCKQPSWRTYLSKHCRFSCGFCGNKGPRPTDDGTKVTYKPITGRPPVRTNPPTGDCRDRVVDCHHQGKHRCNDPNPAWQNYMRRSCRKYCNFC